MVVAPWETPPAHAARVCPVSGVREKEVAPGCLPYVYPPDTNSEQLASDEGLMLSPPKKLNMARLRRVLRGRRFFPFPLGRFRSSTGKCTQENVCPSS